MPGRAQSMGQINLFNHLQGIIIIIAIIICSLLIIFLTSVSWWFLTGVWVTTTPQVSRTLLSILADLNNAEVWMVFTRTVISKSSSPCTNPLGTVLRTPIPIDITFMSYSFFNSLVRSMNLSLLSHSFNFTLWSAGTAKSIIRFFCFVLLIIIRSGRLTGTWWSIFMSKS